MRRIGLGLLLSVSAACGSSSSGPTLPAAPRAAEPSVAPTPSTTPAGTIVALPAGSEPEGIAVDPVTHTAVVELRDPNRLALIDTRSLAVRIVPSPGLARHLTLAKPGGPVLLPAEDRNALDEIAVPSGRVVASTPVLDHPHNAAVVGRNVWVADEFAKAVSVIGPNHHLITNLTGPEQPGGVVAAAGTVGVTDVLGARMYFYDAATYQSRGSIALGAGPTHEARAGGDKVVAVDTRGGALLLVNMKQRKIVGRLSLPGGPYGIASDPRTRRVWVALSALNQLVEVTVRGRHMVRISTTPTVQQPNTVAVDPTTGCTYVAGVTRAQIEVDCPS